MLECILKGGLGDGAETYRSSNFAEYQVRLQRQVWMSKREEECRREPLVVNVLGGCRVTGCLFLKPGTIVVSYVLIMQPLEVPIAAAAARLV